MIHQNPTPKDPTPTPNSEQQFAGTLFAWSETGTEGLVWALQEQNKQGYDGLVVLQAGDDVTIFDKDGAVLFNEVIAPDFRTGWKEHYPGSGHGQPVAGPHWIHWTQKGWEPEAWAELFLSEDNTALVTRPSPPSPETVEDPPST